MNEVYLKMPILLSKGAKFLYMVSGNMIKDFREIKNFRTLSSKEQFAKKMLNKVDSYFDTWITANNIITDKYDKIEGFFFDGYNNFIHGINLWCLIIYTKTYFCVYEPMSMTFYWGNSKEQYIDTTLIIETFNNNNIRVLKDNEILNDTLSLAWLSCNIFDIVSIKHDYSEYTHPIIKILNTACIKNMIYLDNSYNKELIKDYLVNLN